MAKWLDSDPPPPEGFYWLWDVYNDEWLIVKVDKQLDGNIYILVPGEDDPMPWEHLPDGTVLEGPLTEPERD